ncbi:methyltransferase domain-containing protein [Niveibacterium sp. SC-1]|uniref:methyltransferase domain-containing protein n=1 Tax=Niveibacterium sp. SC-1 TaxID=3135646 RepID=UPI00311E6E82
MNTLERQRIGNAFNAASGDYDAHADVQARIAQGLAAYLPDTLGSGGADSSGLILDAGCGTGRGFPLLASRYPRAQHLGLDLAPAMAHRALARGLTTAAADIEALPLRDAGVALYWSSLAWQWCDPLAAAREAARVLAPGGRLCVATLGPGTLRELREAFAVLGDEASHVREFPAAAALTAACEAAGLRELRIVPALHHAHAQDLATLLQGVRSIGAHTLGDARRRGLLGRHAWQAVQARYEQHRGNQGLPASYEALFICATR